MKLKFLMLLSECFDDSLTEASKLPIDVEMAYKQFTKDFKKETGKDVDKASLKELKNSASWRKMKNSLKDPEVYQSDNDYNYFDHIEDLYAKY